MPEMAHTRGMGVGAARLAPPAVGCAPLSRRGGTGRGAGSLAQAIPGPDGRRRTCGGCAPRGRGRAPGLRERSPRSQHSRRHAYSLFSRRGPAKTLGFAIAGGRHTKRQAAPDRSMAGGRAGSDPRRRRGHQIPASVFRTSAAAACPRAPILAVRPWLPARLRCLSRGSPHRRPRDPAPGHVAACGAAA
jgi:hypothetical protein